MLAGYTRAVGRHTSDSWSSYFGPGALTSFCLAALTAAGGLGLPVVWQLRRVLRDARSDERGPADAILVVGRTLDGDRPTAVFRARLDCALALQRSGSAPRILIAGGLTGRATRSEAAAGREYLLDAGLAAELVLLEDHSRNTLENLFNVRERARLEGWQRLIVVSDPLHLARIGALARGLRLQVALCGARAAPPRRGSFGWWQRALREAFLVHWYYVGMAYSRLLGSRRLLERVT